VGPIKGLKRVDLECTIEAAEDLLVLLYALFQLLVRRYILGLEGET